jgi:HAD superfamily hydrolase (TIGR01549 family)
MMIKAVLFDLDDTLLENDMDRFLAHYLPMLAEYMEDLVDPDLFVSELLTTTQIMLAHQDTSVSNEEAFWSTFSGRTGLERAMLEPQLEKFYREEFRRLESITKRRPAAVQSVRVCLDRKLKVVVATNPLFPRSAVEQRMAWAGVPATEFDFALITTYENMHAAKPHSAYYQEIVDWVGVQASEALMVGDDWRNDIVPASGLGMYTYWVSSNCETQPDPPVALDGCGSLDELVGCLSDGWLAG